MFRAKTATFPLKPRLALHAGITGHRLDGLKAADMPLLQERIAKILKEIDAAYRQLAASDEAQAIFADGEALPPRLLSPLAEGADRIAAKAALKHRYDLRCPLPFAREVYAEDFQITSWSGRQP